MLYDRWREVARQQDDAWALLDFADRRHWTFRRLALAAESFPVGEPGPWSHPRGSRAEFVLQVLAGWRERRVVCPLEAAQPPPPVAPPPAGAVHFKLTSGSTGQPRGIWFTAAQLAADAAQIVATMRLRPDWPNLAAISLAHSYGFSNLVLPLLLHGIPLCLVPAPLPELVRHAGEAVGPLTLPSLPVLWRSWHEARCIPASTRLALSAGAPMPLGLETAIARDLGLKVHNFYGASECGGIAFDPSPSVRSSEQYAGRAMLGVDLACDHDGVLVVTSPAVGSGYWPAPDPRLGDGRFATADIARVEDGGLWLVGRSSDVVNVAGRKVHPEAIESILRACPGVEDCVVFGVPAADPAQGDRLLAWVLAPAIVSERALREFARDHLPAWQVPDRFLVRDKLPVNLRGKVSRAALRQAFLESR